MKSFPARQSRRVFGSQQVKMKPPGCLDRRSGSLLTFLYAHGIITGEVYDFPTEGNRWRLASPSFTKEVITMTDYEMLVIVLMMITLCFTIHQLNHKG